MLARGIERRERERLERVRLGGGRVEEARGFRTVAVRDSGDGARRGTERGADAIARERILRVARIDDETPQMLAVRHELGAKTGVARARGRCAALDDMGSDVGAKKRARWLWQVLDPHTGRVLAYGVGSRKDAVFLKLKALLAPFGITQYYTDKAGNVPNQ